VTKSVQDGLCDATYPNRGLEACAWHILAGVAEPCLIAANVGDYGTNILS
jgi:hypothetical protein